MAEPEDRPSVTEVLRRADEGWSSFRATVRALPEDAWDEPVPGDGWTRRKMLNHIRVWHEVTARRLRYFRETGERPPSPGDEDTINAQAAADADLRTRAMILADLDASYGRLLEEVRQLRDEQLTVHESWPVAVVADNTWGHYEEHRADLAEP